ncbi:TraX family protein [Paenibacillus motobuensis]|uniref:Conjugal transfer protein TraX n=1 Tax=Paenibacillus motobuensis TaxID=295324 RepID=A0ABN0Y084_9BACL
MQWIAIVTMLLDHIGAAFFPGELIWRIIGRISFPIYAYALVQGFRYTTSYSKYMLRLTIITVLSQLPYQIALSRSGINVVGTLLVAALLMRLLEHMRPGILSILLIAGCSLLIEVIPFDYGAYGLLLVLIFRYAEKYQLLFIHVLLNVIYLLVYGWVVQMVSIIPTLLIVLDPTIWRRLELIRMPRWLWRSYYPLHLLVLAAVSYWHV